MRRFLVHLFICLVLFVFFSAYAGTNDIVKNVLGGKDLEKYFPWTAQVGDSQQDTGKQVQTQAEGILKKVYTYLNDALYPAEKNKDLFNKIWDWMKTIPARFFDFLKRLTT